MRRWMIVALVAIACSKHTHDEAALPTAPGVFGAVSHLTPGAAESAIKSSAPGLESSAPGEWRLVTGDTSYLVTVAHGVVDEVDVTKQGAKIGVVEQAWGRGVRAGDHGETWLDANQQLRVDVDDSSDLVIRFRHYLPIKNLFTGSDVAAFVGVSVIGRPVDAVKRELASKGFYKRDDVVTGPVAEYGLPVFVVLQAEGPGAPVAKRDQVVRAYSVGGVTSSPESLAIVKPVLAARFGSERAGAMLVGGSIIVSAE